MNGPVGSFFCYYEACALSLTCQPRGTRPKRLSRTHRTMEGGGGGGAGEAASLVFLLEVFLINQAGQLFELFSPDS